MTNHPKRSSVSYRFIAFSTITGQSLQRAATAADVLAEAIRFNRLDDGSFVEVLDCGDDGRKIWNAGVPVEKARKLHRAVYRGGGYAEPQAAVTDLPTIPLNEG